MLMASPTLRFASQRLWTSPDTNNPVRSMASTCNDSRSRFGKLQFAGAVTQGAHPAPPARRWRRSHDTTNVALMKPTPQTLVDFELAQVPKGAPGSALNMYRAAYNMTRLKCLGKKPDGVLPTREAAHLQALNEARLLEPTFDISMPNGYPD